MYYYNHEHNILTTILQNSDPFELFNLESCSFKIERSLFS